MSLSPGSSGRLDEDTAAGSRAVHRFRKFFHWPVTFHGSQAILSAEVSQRQIAELAAALRRGLAD
ncbi:hypothetical protein [Amycolatopsis sp. NPDC051372]|uniref:hypothetical protein n=1 Tax=unclassified Amycolatopsis TaxID=2618356 RepID=UPI00341605B7